MDWTAALAAYADQRRTDRRGLPQLSAVPSAQRNRRNAVDRADPLALLNAYALAKTLGATGTGHGECLRHQYRDEVLSLVGEFGLEGDRARRDRPESLVGLLRCSLSGPMLRFQLQHLQVACYIVVAYLSGMRDSEVASLRRGCVRLRRAEDGSIERYYVDGLTFKGVGSSEHGESATWVVIEPVARAVGVLESLLAAAGAAPAARILTDVRLSGTADARVTASHRGYSIRQWVVAVNKLAAASTRTPPIPDHDGRPWQFSTGMFRRTLAWFIATEPFGIVAGAIQYKHASIAMFEGYAGTRAGGLKDDVERARARHTLTLVREAYEDRKHGRPTSLGGGAKALDAELDAIRTALGDVPGAAEVDEARLLKRLKHPAAMLHLGFVNDCFYREEYAACKPWQVEPGVPTFARCTPDACPNSRLAERHRPAWARAHEDARVHLARARNVSANQRRIISAAVERYKRMLDLFDRIIDDNDDIHADA